MNTPFSEIIVRDFAAESSLATGLNGYVYREEQVQLACEIADAFDGGNILLAEAETGTGKTLAYLIPALRSSDKILISTHTKALQDQLMHRDIPAVQKAMGVRRKIALLKGRSNYLCPFRMKKFATSGQLEMWIKRSLLKVVKWSEKTVDGDLSALPFDVFEKGIGPLVTATGDQCGGSKCPDWNDCPLMKARKKAQDADIVISNHSLLLADAALKAGEFGDVLPSFDAYVLDEAHSLPDLASQHFGIQLTRMKLIQWLNDIQGVLDELADETALKKEITEAGRVALDAWLKDGMEPLKVAWKSLVDLTASRAERSEDIVKLLKRAEQLAQDMKTVEKPSDGFVAWTDGHGEHKRHVVAPVETGPVLNEHLWERPASFVLLSATLRLSESFTYARNRLGLEEEKAKEVFHPSPFDYKTQALNYLPRHLMDTRSEEGQEALLNEIETLLRASRGRAFVLFTSYKMLNRIASELEEKLPWTVLIQGSSGSKDAILDEFRKDTHSVLCGTRSFWEGVDVPGESLSLVIIDKMPFAPPNDPLLQARIKSCEEQGGNGFMDIQLPEAIAVLRQGVGRLIRNNEDRGVMAILDSRLYQKRYGREVVKNLPPAPVCDDVSEVRWFFEDED
ncbi:MAG: ATP-dependent DNA helicase [Mariprofundaceae bacterium]